MKQIILILTLGLVYFNLSAQNIIHVNNAPGSSVDYSDLQAAIDAAQSDDLIYLYGSGITYGNIVISKKVNIQGPGYLLGANFGGIQNPSPAILNSLNIDQNIEGAFISGITVESGIDIENSGNIIIEKSLIERGFYTSNSSNISISNCLFRDTPGSIKMRVDRGCSQVVFTNCISEYSGIEVHELSSATFINNIIFGWSSTITFGINNSIFKNNIILTSYTINGNSNTIIKNVFTHPSRIPPADNIKADNSEVFEGYPDQGSFSPDERYKLKQGSPAIGYGEGGTDCGIFGGADPYVLSGLPSIPVIYDISGPATAPAGGTINVTVKARIEN